MPTREPNRLQIRFLGQPMAQLVQAGDPPEYALAFEPAFLESGHDLSPLNLPLETLGSQPTIYREGTSPFPGGLPGLLADSLPDSWGLRLQKLSHPSLKTLLGRFAAVGSRGPGAITFEPVLDSDEKTDSVNLAQLADEAIRLQKSPAELTSETVDSVLAKGGSSLGGAQPKTTAYLPIDAGVIALKEILVGGQPPPGYHPCILKFSPEDDEGGGAVEYAFSLMARQAGLNLSPCALVYDGKRRHFATARFDRMTPTQGNPGRRHVHTLSGLLHRRASDGQIDYEDFIRLARRLAGASGAEECFRRAVFNLLATNRDDHGRNHAFLYDERSREWSLSPAYDLTPNVSNVLIALSWLGSMEIPTSFSQLYRLAEIVGISRAKSREIYGKVEFAVGQWPRIASEVEIPKNIINYWEKEMLHQTKALRSTAG
jgi:serine/threonine-protein kinase HipA